jgi:hypothetical protein
MMAQLNIRIDDQSRDMLDALARARGLNTSDLVRELIRRELGFDRDDRIGGEMAPRSLSVIERRQLGLLHQILEVLTRDEGETADGWAAQYHHQMVEILDSGYVADYYKPFEPVRPELTDRECTLVHDILEMFMWLERSAAELTDAERSTLGDSARYGLVFRGFDFNDSVESRLAGYAHYLIKDDRYRPLADRFDDRHERGNSHAPLLATYQRMLAVWKPIWDRKTAHIGGLDNYLLTADELREVLAARPYPGNDRR